MERLILSMHLPKRSYSGSILVLFIVFCITNCQQFRPKTKKLLPSTPQSAASTSVDDGLVHQLAQVESVAAQVSPLDSTKASITISGLLHDGATQVQDIQQQRLADAFVITVTTVRLKSATASLAIIPFDRTISVSLTGMPKGLCKIMVNGVATTLMIP